MVVKCTNISFPTLIEVLMRRSEEIKFAKYYKFNCDITDLYIFLIDADDDIISVIKEEIGMFNIAQSEVTLIS